MNIVAQVFGTLALVSLCYNYLQTDKKKFLLIHVIVNILFGLQYLTLKAMSAFFMSIVSIMVSFLFYKYEEKNKRAPVILLILFEIVIVVLERISYNTWYSLIPTIIAMLFTFGVWQKDIRITYIIAVLCSVAWIYYNFLVGAYVSVISSVIELIASIVGLTKSIRFKNNIKNINENINI